MKKQIIAMLLLLISTTIFAGDSFNLSNVLNPGQEECSEINKISPELQAIFDSEEYKAERDAALADILGSPVESTPTLSDGEREKRDMHELIDSYGVQGAIEYWIARERSLKCAGLYN